MSHGKNAGIRQGVDLQRQLRSRRAIFTAGSYEYSVCGDRSYEYKVGDIVETSLYKRVREDAMSRCTVYHVGYKPSGVWSESKNRYVCESLNDCDQCERETAAKYGSIEHAWALARKQPFICSNE